MCTLMNGTFGNDLEDFGHPAWVKTPEGRYLAASRQLALHVGARLDDMIGRPDREFWSGSAARSFRAGDEAALAQRAAVAIPEPGSSPATMLVTLKLPLWRNGRILGTMGFFFETSAGTLDRVPTECRHLVRNVGASLRRAGISGPAPEESLRSGIGFAPQPGTAPPWLEHVRDAVVAGFRGRISIPDLAEAVERHPSHVGRAFRQSYGERIHDFIRRLRVNWASVRLLSTPTEVGRIALAAGYADHSHFARDFRRVMGVTPTEYRRLAVPDNDA